MARTMAKAKSKGLQKPGRRGRKIRVLPRETQLSSRLASASRQQVPFMLEPFRNFLRVELVPKQMHARSDLRKFLDLA